MLVSKQGFSPRGRSLGWLAAIRSGPGFAVISASTRHRRTPQQQRVACADSFPALPSQPSGNQVRR
eukprot:7122019-Prymnesium_polylepis.2